MFLIKGLLIQLVEWIEIKLKGYKYAFECLEPGCHFVAHSNDPTTMAQVSLTHANMHAYKKEVGHG